MNAARNRRRRGEPAIALLTILLGWVGARLITSVRGAEIQQVGSRTAPQVEAQRALTLERSAKEWRPAECCSPSRIRGAVSFLNAPGESPLFPPETAQKLERSQTLPGIEPPEGAATRLVGESSQEFSASSQSSNVATPSGSSTRAHQLGPKSWSSDIWAFWRKGWGGAAIAPGVASYGRSQAGGVLRYAFEDDGRGSTAYVRTSTALGGVREREVAAGLSVQPIAAAPVRAAVEARLNGTAAGSELRLAAYLVSQVPPFALPGGLRGEVYGQAGYVGGKFKSAFADGQAKVDRQVAAFSGGAELKAGASAWGGAQRGAARLDVGPVGALSFPLGAVGARISAEYRIRVAGEANPGSGPALTFSAGF